MALTSWTDSRLISARRHIPRVGRRAASISVLTVRATAAASRARDCQRRGRRVCRACRPCQPLRASFDRLAWLWTPRSDREERIVSAAGHALETNPPQGRSRDQGPPCSPLSRPRHRPPPGIRRTNPAFRAPHRPSPEIEARHRLRAGLSSARIPAALLPGWWDQVKSLEMNTEDRARWKGRRS